MSTSLNISLDESGGGTRLSNHGGSGHGSAHGKPVWKAEESAFRDVEETRMPIMSSEGSSRWVPSNYVQRTTLLLLAFGFGLLIIIMSIVSATNKNVSDGFSKLNDKLASSNALGLPGYESMSWADILSAGKATQTVNVYIDSGSPKVQRWFTYVAVPQVLAQYGITINPVFTLASGTYQIVQQIETEVASGKVTSGGSVDLFWGNGANFYRAKTGNTIPGVTTGFGSAASGLGNILYGPWANKVPSAKNFDWTSATIAFDMGTSTDGLEMPFFAANFNLIYRTDVGIIPPTTFQDLLVLLNTPACAVGTAQSALCGLKNVFTYWNPSTTPASYITAAFTRHFLYENCATTVSSLVTYQTPAAATAAYKAATTCAKDYAKYISTYNSALYQASAQNAFQQLRILESGYPINGAMPQNTKANLYNFAYCADESTCQGLYRAGTIFATMEYSAPYAGSNCADTTGTGTTSWGSSSVANLCTNTAAYVPTSSGAISNNNFMMIPSNAANKLGAVVVGNWLGSMDAQYSRRNGAQADSSYLASDGKSHVLNRWIGNFATNSPAYTGSDGGPAWKTAYDYLSSYNNYPQTPDIKYLRPPYALPEIDVRYQTQMNADWVSCMGLTATSAAYPTVATVCP